jgi:hypothetical protein
MTIRDSAATCHRARRRRFALAAIALVGLVVLAGCGDSDDETTDTTDGSAATTGQPTSTTSGQAAADDAFCAAGDDLREDVEALADLDVVAEGVDGVRQQLDTIQDDVAALRESGREVAADEIASLETALDDLRTAVDALAGGDISAANARNAIAAIGEVGTAANAVRTQLDEAC